MDSRWSVGEAGRSDPLLEVWEIYRQVMAQPHTDLIQHVWTMERTLAGRAGRTSPLDGSSSIILMYWPKILVLGPQFGTGDTGTLKPPPACVFKCHT
jgi:hypothetical protein